MLWEVKAYKDCRYLEVDVNEVLENKTTWEL